MSRCKLSEQYFANFIIRGRFPKDAKISRKMVCDIMLPAYWLLPIHRLGISFFRSGSERLRSRSALRDLTASGLTDSLWFHGKAANFWRGMLRWSVPLLTPTYIPRLTLPAALLKPLLSGRNRSTQPFRLTSFFNPLLWRPTAHWTHLPWTFSARLAVGWVLSLDIIARPGSYFSASRLLFRALTQSCTTDEDPDL